MSVNRATLFLIQSVVTLLLSSIQTSSGTTLLSKHCAAPCKSFPHLDSFQTSFLKPSFTHLPLLTYQAPLLESPHFFSYPTQRSLFPFILFELSNPSKQMLFKTVSYFYTPIPHQPIFFSVWMDKIDTLASHLTLSSWWAPTCQWQSVLLSSGHSYQSYSPHPWISCRLLPGKGFLYGLYSLNLPHTPDCLKKGGKQKSMDRHRKYFFKLKTSLKSFAVFINIKASIK